jgi:hypothetical protein
MKGSPVRVRASAWLPGAPSTSGDLLQLLGDVPSASSPLAHVRSSSGLRDRQTGRADLLFRGNAGSGVVVREYARVAAKTRLRIVPGLAGDLDDRVALANEQGHE